MKVLKAKPMIEEVEFVHSDKSFGCSCHCKCGD